jgi:hypothetical protein
MDDIGNLLYILVFVIWFLYRTFGKGGKKPARPAGPADQGRPDPDYQRERGPSKSTPPPVTFEDILRELTGAPPESRKQEPETVQEIPEEYYAGQDEETSFEVLEPEMPSRAEKKPEIGIPSLPGPKLTSRTKEVDVKKKRSPMAARKAFEMFRTPQGAKQAFIMKEIFDRKY